MALQLWNGHISTRRDPSLTPITNAVAQVDPATFVPAPEGIRAQRMIFINPGLDIQNGDWVDITLLNGSTIAAKADFVDPVDDIDETLSYIAIAAFSSALGA